MTLKLDALDADDCERIRRWRNDALETLRTPFPLTTDQQGDFYRDIVCNRNSPHRYYALRLPASSGATWGPLVGCGGLTNIMWENGCTEISLIMDPNQRGAGHGGTSVRLLLEEAFLRLRLVTVLAECYEVNPAIGFWVKMGARFQAHSQVLPRRKFCEGRLFDSLLLTFTPEGFSEATKTDAA